MISNLTKKIIGLRIKTMVYTSLGSHFNWDTLKEEMTLTNNYHNWNLTLMMSYNIIFPIVMTMHLISKLYDEEGIGSGAAIGSYVVGWAEVLTVGLLFGFEYRIMQYRKHFVFLTNQMFQYSKKIEDLLTEKNIQLHDSHLKVIRTAELVMLFTAIVSLFIPIGFGASFCNALEPTHILVKEVLEVDVKMSLQHFPFVLLIVLIVSLPANAAFLLIMIGICNYTLAHICISSLNPISVEQRITRVHKNHQHSKCMIEYVVTTENFGDMDDTTMLDMYRIQQLFNKLLNEFFGSIIIAFNHVTCMGVLVFFCFIVIKHSQEIANAGIIVIVAVVAAIMATLIAEWYEAQVAGNIYEVSHEFVGKVRRITGRNSGAHKRVASCPSISFDLARPFFSVDKHTFLQFVYQGLDFLTTLLLM
ncbi:unnamed protein product [Orchesella dallaii]|uniref:Odorant receptor n=1 Tax=Orchesella dallaii TaxID=48710 RepID=A0ABP1PQC5_9HEXA